MKTSQVAFRFLDGASRPELDAGNWPTTQRFSRRLGETQRDAEYACAIERLPGRQVLDTETASWVMVAVSALAVLAAFAMVFWAPT